MPTSTETSFLPEAATARGAHTRDEVARRLLAASAKHSLDPTVEVDWTAVPLPETYYCPARRCSLYGTDLWATLTEQQRIELSKHEAASIASLGIWFEVILMRMMLRQVYARGAAGPRERYALTEIADECRHSTMFGRMTEAFGAPRYGPGPVVHMLGAILSAAADPTLIYGGALYVEEMLDALQREAMADDSVQPMVRQVSRVHVVEEARHIRFARSEMPVAFGRLGPARRLQAQLVLGAIAYVATTRLIDPDVYRSVGLDPREAAAVARRNPHWHATRAFAARKVVTFFAEQGVVTPLARRLFWRPAHLMA